MTKKKIALITGITGQDGSYLCEFLLKKNYIVYGIKRRSSSFNTWRLDYLRNNPVTDDQEFHILYGDLTDTANMISIVQEIQPDEIYNLGAQSHVKVSFDKPAYSAQVNSLGTLVLLDAIRIAGLEEKCRFYQASSSELYGKALEVPQNENTPFYPRSPYAVAKLYAYWICVNYRESYDMHCSNGILFNHESPLRGATFVTRKITRAVAAQFCGSDDILYLGNLDARRDWGHAKDYIEGMWLMLQQEESDDYVLATGETHRVRDFVNEAYKYTDFALAWRGEGVHEEGYDEKTGRILVKVSADYFRPSEVDLLIGDPTKAKEKLGWQHKISFPALVKDMFDSDVANYKRGYEFG